jgi:hypothetical protein
MIVGWWALAGCVPEEAGTSSTPEPPPPPMVIDAGPEEAGRSAIPCQGVHVVRIVNQDVVEHRVDAVSFAARLGAVRLDEWDVDAPQVVRPGLAMEVPLRDDGAEPGPTAGTLTVETDVGTLTAEVLGERTFGEPRAETFVVSEPLVDVVLAVDQSGNMPDDYAADFADGVDGWLDALSDAWDWRLILVHEQDACADGGVWAEGDRGVAAALGRDAFSAEPHPLDERLLELASRALAENAPTECNGDFRRDGAQLQVVVVSDEPEQSSQPASFWVNDYFDYADVVTVSGVVDEDRRCNGGDDGYEDAIAATGGVSIDLCAAGWSAELPRLVDALVPIPPSFPLEGGAVEGSIVVRVDGRPVSATFDEGTGLLTLDEGPPPGTEVEVTWSSPAVCR